MIVAICLMYATYLGLFMNFFARRYLGRALGKGGKEMDTVDREHVTGRLKSKETECKEGLKDDNFKKAQ
jgi:hypothetical protein